MSKVTLIKRSQPFCAGCAKVQAMLEGEGILHEVIDITEQPDAIEEFDLTAVPVTIVERENAGTIRFIGEMTPEEIKEAIV